MQPAVHQSSLWSIFRVDGQKVVQLGLVSGGKGIRAAGGVTLSHLVMSHTVCSLLGTRLQAINGCLCVPRCVCVYVFCVPAVH